MSLSLVLPRLFALFVVLVVFVLHQSLAHTLWHFVVPLFHNVLPYCLLRRPLFLTCLTLSDHARAASHTVMGLLATLVTDPSFESTTASALVTKLVDFAATCCLDYFVFLVTGDVLEDRQFELECLAADIPHLAAMLLSPEGDPDALDIPAPRSYAEAISRDYSSHRQTSMDPKMASKKSTGTYVDEVPPPGANIVDGMWNFRVKRPPDSLPAFKARYVARGFNQRQGV
ncbi:unnamed protein product [Closterium sp. NIES-54]